MSRRVVVVAGVLLFVLAGAAGTSAIDASRSSLAEPAPDILVTRDSTRLPAGCRPRAAARLVVRFFAAINRGDRRGLRRTFWAQRGTLEAEAFKWYAVQDGVGDAYVTDRRRLLAYFATRHKQHERLGLRHLDIGAARGTGGVSFVIVRRADDLPAGLGGEAGIAEGKAGINCRAQTIYGWSMSMEMAPGERFPRPGLFNRRGPCPLPKRWDPLTGPIIACVRAR